MKNNTLMITVTAAVVIGALAFFAGMQWQKSQVSAAGGGQFAQGSARGQFGQTGLRGRGGFGNATIGKILSQDANSITVQLQDGSSKIINVSSSTMINKMVSATIADLATGQSVAVFGTTNADGSVSATRIQLNPMMRQGGQPTPSQ